MNINLFYICRGALLIKQIECCVSYSTLPYLYCIAMNFLTFSFFLLQKKIFKKIHIRTKTKHWFHSRMDVYQLNLSYENRKVIFWTTSCKHILCIFIFLKHLYLVLEPCKNVNTLEFRIRNNKLHNIFLEPNKVFIEHSQYTHFSTFSFQDSSSSSYFGFHEVLVKLQNSKI